MNKFSVFNGPQCWKTSHSFSSFFLRISINYLYSHFNPISIPNNCCWDFNLRLTFLYIRSFQKQIHLFFWSNSLYYFWKNPIQFLFSSPIDILFFYAFLIFSIKHFSVLIMKYIDRSIVNLWWHLFLYFPSFLKLAISLLFYRLAVTMQQMLSPISWCHAQYSTSCTRIRVRRVHPIPVPLQSVPLC